MAAPTTIDDFLQLVRRSALVAEPVLDSWLQAMPAAEKTADPSSLAAALVRDRLLTNFQAEQLLLGKSRGFTIGRFKILERLGQGGMALVYLCEDPNTQHRVAIKVLPTSHAKEEEFLKRFDREGRVALTLDNPNIVRTFEAGQDGKLNFLVMEYIDGTTLQALVHKFGPLTIPRAAHYVRQAALGLQAAYEAGMVHRDIKPGNLIVDRSGTVKVMDMGLARILEAEEGEEVLTRTVLGTPDYVAPEQSQDSHNVDIRADIYSLGCTLYFLLSGAPPFPEGTVAQKFIWHQTRAPKPIRALRPEVPEGLAAVVHRMLAKEPEKRYQTPAEVAEALLPWAQVLPAPPSEKELPHPAPTVRLTKETASDLVITPVEAPLSGRGVADARKHHTPTRPDRGIAGPATTRGLQSKPESPPGQAKPESSGTSGPERPRKVEPAARTSPKTQPRLARQEGSDALQQEQPVKIDLAAQIGSRTRHLAEEQGARQRLPWAVLVLLLGGLAAGGAALAWWWRHRGGF